ncbi:MAG: phosphatase PAP2 family protein [Chitinophagaceae bacterium]|nr:MAG: phosphatase PAP2 family protein [Chitinophagaceae bacterium]
MTTSPNMDRHLVATVLFLAMLPMLLLLSCNKKDEKPNNQHKPSSYSSEVLTKWMALQQRLMRNATGIPNQALSRHYAYSGVAALESLRPGLHNQPKWTEKWNGLTGLPQPEKSKNYYHPANVNAAMAAINKAMFPNASVTDKAAIDSLETALTSSFLTSESQALITSSSQYGKAVAAAVFAWAETDGYKDASKPYNVPVGVGLWKPTAPSFAAPATPYWGENRTIIKGSTVNTQVPAPFTYSTDPASSFYQMVKQLYDASQTLTADQKEMAIFWRDVPGATTPGHWLGILQQVIEQTHSSLEKAAIAYALSGTAMNDALITCFKSKYQFNLVRPITYIREVMGHTSWNSFIGTPAHPEYASAHASLSAAIAEVLQVLFGNINSFTDHTYDGLGFAPRSYSSMRAVGEEAGISRLYAGIHYGKTIELSLIQGKKVAENILSNNSSN